jgi:cytochrome b561
MEVSFGILVLLFLIALGIWSHKKDIAKYGPITKRDRLNTLLSLFVSLALGVFLFVLSVYGFLILSLVLYLLFHFASFGEGKRGLYRQIRDGTMLGWLMSLPICLVIWQLSDKT